ncbi:MAG: dihydrolipoamide acetyltransferase family protein [Acidimicrobiales bacterium]
MPDAVTDARTDIFALPSLGADMDWGSVLEWRVAPGDRVERGDVIAVVATEKADIDVEIWQPGVVAELLLDVGREVPVGTPMLRFEVHDLGPSVVDTPPAVVAATESTPIPTPAMALPIEPAPSGALASPLARQLAAERGVELSAVVGTGPQGAVLAADVEAIAPIVPVATPSVVTVAERDRAAARSAGMRHAIAERMAKANRDIPHYHLDLGVDLGPMLAALEAHNAALPVAERVLPAAVFLEAVAHASAKHPELNGTWGDDGFDPSATVDLAVAISLRTGGLVTPVISDAVELTTTEIMLRLKELVTAARSGSLRSSWMVDGSITVTNLGDNGADRVHGVIFPPQVALVGFGSIVRRPWVVDGTVVDRPVVTVSLAADHRATDGLVGSRFLATIAHRLEHPELS